MSALPEPLRRGCRIRVRGMVQGTGFRPFVWRLAQACGISGEVWNDAGGVVIAAWGIPAALQQFLERLEREAPPQARIDAVETAPLTGREPGGDFTIAPSGTGDMHTGVPVDVAACPECVAEVLDPGDRRFRYALNACARCGPRVSMVTAVPYDRHHTSMAPFALCARCEAEYGNPDDRRFHAQGVACPECGPRLSLAPLAPPDAGEPALQRLAQLYRQAVEGRDPVQAAAFLLRRGAIVAIKGLGGYQLACDARSGCAVTRLRRRKRRYGKPLALMAADVAMVTRYCRVSEQEAQLLASHQAPIVVLDTLPYADGPDHVAAAVAPGHRSLGFMLPYTPLHHLLLRDCGFPIVLTSGNVSGEPQCTDEEQVRERLAGIADFVLGHDRGIAQRMDDSLVRVAAGVPRLLRRARGYAPAPLAMPAGFEHAPAVLAMGGEYKNTFCLLKDGEATLSQHLGDMDAPGSQADCRGALALYTELFDHRPRAVAIDMHPDYLASRLGRGVAVERGVRAVTVQHHHAHVAACMAEHGIALDAGPVLGVALDGLGYGDDGGLWGGEFLLADYRGALRLARLRPAPLIGGARAAREPWRCAYAQLHAAMEWDRIVSRYGGLELIRVLRAKPLATLDAMIAYGVNAPPASSCGRLFDAVAAAVGIHCDAVAYEGQAAAALEARVDREALAEPGYRLGLGGDGTLGTLDPAPLWPALLEDVKRGVAVPQIAARFHRGLADGVAALAAALAGPRGIRTIVLSGGVMHNRVLLELLTDGLQRRGFTVLSPARVPSGDGGLALGQAAVAAARLL